MTKLDRIAKLREQVAAQRRWIEEHGGSRAGYIIRYGSAAAAPEDRYGDGGEAIYAADAAELEKLIAEMVALENSFRSTGARRV